MKNNIKIDKQLIKAFNEGKVQLFIGSGLSSPPYPTTNDFRDTLLFDPSCDYEDKNTLKEILGDENVSLEDVAEFFEIYRGSKELIRIIKETYSPSESYNPKPIHKKLWKLPNIKLIYTTNFDCLIEKAIERPKEPPRVVIKASELKGIEAGERIVFKPHGCASLSNDRSEFVISRGDYLNYNYNNPLEVLTTKYDISQKTFVFLGYSLRDINMRQIITEANLMNAGVKAYAVMKNVVGPEAKYWKKQEVTLIPMDAEEFIDNLLKCFIIDESEWGEKIGERITEKKQISQKAVDIIKNKACQGKIAIYIDSGSTCLHFAKVLIEKIKDDKIPSKNIILITNSTQVISLISQTNLSPDQCFDFKIIGGWLKYPTQAIVNTYYEDLHPNKKDLLNQVKMIISFIGVTSINDEGLMTKTNDEIIMKQFFINESDEVYILADHDKIRHLREGKVFSPLLKDKMVIVTDRIERMEKEFGPLVKAVIGL